MPASQPTNGQVTDGIGIWMRLPPNGLAGASVRELQRARIFSAFASICSDGAFDAVTVTQVVSRAGVSRRTFYDLFEGRDECLLAAFEESVERAMARVTAASEDQARWPGKMRAGLHELLRFLDEEPARARVCVLCLATAQPQALVRRDQLLTRFAADIDNGRNHGRNKPPSLTADALVGGVLAVIHRSVLDREAAPLSSLTNELMATVVYPYLGGARARRELSRRMPRPKLPHPAPPVAPRGGCEIRVTYRTARALDAVARRPGASNREIATHAGIPDEGQASRLLSRLQTARLTVNKSEGPTAGTPNAWNITPSGVELLRRIHPGPDLLGASP